jgi:hypothetical protein
MGWIDNGIAKSKAAASEARADLAEVNSRLVFAEAWQKTTGAGDAAARSIAGSRVGRLEALAPVLEIMTTQSDAVHARAVARVDDLQVQRQTAQGRLTIAEKSRSAMTRLAEETDKLIGE